MARGRRLLDADGGIAVVDASAVCQLPCGVVDGGLRRNRRAGALDEIVFHVAKRRARKLELCDMAADVVDAVGGIGVDEPERDAVLASTCRAACGGPARSDWRPGSRD